MPLCPASLGHPLGRGASTIMHRTDANLGHAQMSIEWPAGWPPPDTLANVCAVHVTFSHVPCQRFTQS